MDKKKCDKCDLPATYHAVEIVNGNKVQKHLCEEHAAEEGLAFKASHKPINELLTNFVKLHSGVETTGDLVCDNCDLTFSEFQERSLLGCPHCYAAFEDRLSNLLEQAHEGGDRHVGKAPKRGGAAEDRQEQLLRMHKRLHEAVTAEDYELAAHLRDEIGRLENPV